MIADSSIWSVFYGSISLAAVIAAAFFFRWLKKILMRKAEKFRKSETNTRKQHE